MAKKLTKLDLLKLPSIGTPNSDSVAFAAKSDGLYQKVGTKEDKLATIEDTKNEIPLVIGTQTATTASWAGVLPLDKLESGTTIRYWLPRTSASGVTLNLTLKGGGTTGAINCYVRGTTRLTTHYPAGSYINMTYLEGALINGTAYTGWWAQTYYADGTESYTVRWNTPVRAGSEITRYKIVMQGSDGGYHPITIGNTTAATKTVSTVPFLIGSPILWYFTTATVASGALTSTSYNYTAYTTSTTTYTFNQSSGFRAGEDVYLKGTVNGAFFTLDNTTLTSHLTQDLPTVDDGFYYMRLGVSSNTTTGFRLTNQHPIYYFQGGELQSLNTSHGADWNELLNKPATFAPSGHNHTVAQITNFPTKWDWSNLSGVPTTFTPSAHNHDTLYKEIGYHPTWAQVTNKPSTFAPSEHNHTVAQITGFPTKWAWADLSDVPTTFAPSAHSHGNISNDGKIGATKNLMIQTSTDGVLVAKTAGTTAQYLRGDGAWGTPPNTNTTYSAMSVAEGKAGTATSLRTMRADYLKEIIQHYDTNTTYTAGAGLTLSGTQFSLPVTVTGTGTFVKSVTQGADGVSVTLGTPPNTNTTYSAMSVAEGKAGTATSLRTMRADYLKEIIQYYNTNTTYTASTGLTLTNTAFSVKYGTAAGTAAQGNDSRINNGQTAYGWGNHASAGYIKSYVDTKYTAGTNIQISETNVISATDTKYTHPTTTARASGLYKITVNTLGHVTGATAVVKTDITELGISEVGPQGPRGYTGDKGDKPSHGWSGTSLRFENPNGTWGSYVNLKGDPGSNGTNGTNGFTWRPAVNTAGDLTWTRNSSTTTPADRNIKGPKGDAGAPGLTTSIKVNGSTWTQSGGTITLPNYVPVTGGTFTGSITATKMFRSSDIRLKDNICPVDTSKIDDIKLIEFNWKSDNKKDYGVIAQDLEVYYPELVNTDDTGMKSVNYESLYAIKIARLEERIKELEDKLWLKN